MGRGCDALRELARLALFLRALVRRLRRAPLSDILIFYRAPAEIVMGNVFFFFFSFWTVGYRVILCLFFGASFCVSVCVSPVCSVLYLFCTSIASRVVSPSWLQQSYFFVHARVLVVSSHVPTADRRVSWRFVWRTSTAGSSLSKPPTPRTDQIDHRAPFHDLDHSDDLLLIIDHFREQMRS